VGAALMAGLLFSVSLVSPSRADALDAVPSIDVVRSRLSLTPAQDARLTPIFQDRASQLSGLKSQLEQAASRQDRRGILREAKKQADEFNKQVESQLDVSQKQEWRELRAQTREKVKRRVEEKRDSGG
jgi:Skp family chaperone for outer membrane proteins